MHRFLWAMGVSLCLGTLLYSDESMSARIESVVDEVSELRQRYEVAVEKNRACTEQVDEQQKQMQKIAKNEGYDYELFEKNRQEINRLEVENAQLKRRLQGSVQSKSELDSLHKEIEVIKRENARINSSAKILADKNHALMEQINKLKRSNADQSSLKQTQGLERDLVSLQRELEEVKQKNRDLQERSQLTQAELQEKFSHSQDVIKKLQKERNIAKRKLDGLSKKNTALSLQLREKESAPVQRASSSSTVECEPKRIISDCKDDNPFPQLMMKENKAIAPHAIETDILIEVNKSPAAAVVSERIVTEKASAYRMNKEAAIYDAPNGKQIDLWEAKTSFTSNISEGEWIKITGHFVNRKWEKSTTEMWVKIRDTIKR